jgi:hypothetical protein
LASNCEKDVILEFEKQDNPLEFKMEDYLLNDQVVHNPQRNPFLSFAHVALMVAIRQHQFL